MRTLRQLLGAVALLMGAAAPVALGPAPAHAAGSCTSQGVAVVVDFGALGGGVQQGCASSAGKAAALFAAAGHSLTRVQNAPSAVCSVDAKPSQPCPQMPPANAYWGLFWSNGTRATWTYASVGVDSLSVPAGGSVAFAWQGSAGTRAPGVAPAVTKTAAPAAPKSTKATSKPKATPKPAPTAKPRPTGAPSSTAPTTASPAASPTGSASAEPKPHHRPKHRATAGAAATPTTPVAAPSAGASASPATTATEPMSAPTKDDGGLPGWVAPVVVVGVLAAGGGVAAARRRTRG